MTTNKPLLIDTLKVKGEITVDKESAEIALSLMQAIAYDNGFFNRWIPERYKAAFVNKIGLVAKPFYDQYPNLLNEEDIELLCAGEESEMKEKFSTLTGFDALHAALNDFFENH